MHTSTRIRTPVCVEATKREPPKTPKEQWDDFVQIRKHLDELEAKQATEAEDGKKKTSKSSSQSSNASVGLDERPARSECVAPFRDWLTANGAEVQDVTSLNSNNRPRKNDLFPRLLLKKFPDVDLVSKL